MGSSPSHREELQAQYADSANLNARVRLHRDYSVNPRPFHLWLFDQVEALTGATVLEVGCGPGWLWRYNSDRVPPDWRVHLTDLSPGMAAEAAGHMASCGIAGAAAVCDAEGLPFSAASVDMLFANHMLNHVADVPRALGEFCRVLRPGGALYAATNGRRHLREFDLLLQSARPGLRWRPEGRVLGFSLDDAEKDLAPFFPHIEKRPYTDELRVTRARPVVDFLASTMQDLGDEVLTAVEAIVQKEIDQKGHYLIGKESGLLIARP